MKKVIIIGAGAAGLMAAVSAAKAGARVTVLEKMPSIGKKLLITGKGRCNITNSGALENFMENMPGNGTFLYSAIHSFNNQDIIAFMNEHGVPTKLERGGRVFPVSDKAADVVKAFQKALSELKVEVLCQQTVKKITSTGETLEIVTAAEQRFAADAIVLATGGSSYPGTGSSGDGYNLARELGHTIVPLKPSLVPLEVAEDWITDLQGLSLKNVTAAVSVNGVEVGSEFGEMLFTHFGVSGPIILSLSKKIAEALQNKRSTVLLKINLKPALTREVLDKRLQRDFEKYSRKQVKNALNDLLPNKLIDTVMDLAFLDPEKPINQVTKEERSRLLEVITALTFTIVRTRPLSEAIVTAGGIHIKEINPKTMQSKLIQNLYFAGEVIDIDGYTGGYNLQAAFSTGFVAGKNAAD
ncbi:MAG: NAD(P)/FAD-dependent oxidoreductase [Pelosinus sp.]|nr:NAD(P)/FAD-dependent oxidoreductase [Pelosinus sp.]